VTGVIELNFEVAVSAKSEEEAEQLGKEAAEDGVGLDIPTGDTRVLRIEKVAKRDRR
jgi:hypothetical protein